MSKQLRLVKPDHRCPKCKTPLWFKHNYVRTNKEIDAIMEKWKKESWYKRPSRDDLLIDKGKQYWACPKCFEQYIYDEFEGL
jgi:hypothetical protein